MKGIMYIGALRELSRHQELVFPDGVYGVSVGAIVGTYIAFGLPLDLGIEEAFKISISRGRPKATYVPIIEPTDTPYTPSGKNNSCRF